MTLNFEAPTKMLCPSHQFSATNQIINTVPFQQKSAFLLPFSPQVSLISFSPITNHQPFIINNPLPITSVSTSSYSFKPYMSETQDFLSKSDSNLDVSSIPNVKFSWISNSSDKSIIVESSFVNEVEKEEEKISIFGRNTSKNLLENTLYHHSFHSSIIHKSNGIFKKKNRKNFKGKIKTWDEDSYSEGNSSSCDMGRIREMRAAKKRKNARMVYEIKKRLKKEVKEEKKMKEEKKAKIERRGKEENAVVKEKGEEKVRDEIILKRWDKKGKEEEKEKEEEKVVKGWKGIRVNRIQIEKKEIIGWVDKREILMKIEQRKDEEDL